jgi:hypothetical protein
VNHELPDVVAGKGASAGDAPTSNIHDEVRRAVLDSHTQALESWVRIMAALAASNEPADRMLAGAVKQHISKMPFAIDFARSLKTNRQQELPGVQPAEDSERQPFVPRPRDRAVARESEQPVLAAGRARGQAAEEPPARARKRVDSPHRVKASLAPGCARP